MGGAQSAHKQSGRQPNTAHPIPLSLLESDSFIKEWALPSIQTRHCPVRMGAFNAAELLTSQHKSLASPSVNDLGCLILITDSNSIDRACFDCGMLTASSRLQPSRYNMLIKPEQHVNACYTGTTQAPRLTLQVLT